MSLFVTQAGKNRYRCQATAVRLRKVVRLKALLSCRKSKYRKNNSQRRQSRCLQEARHIAKVNEFQNLGVILFKKIRSSLAQLRIY